MKLFLTEYTKDGIQHEGPIIVAPNFELALEQAQYLDIKLVGELAGFYNPYGDSEKVERTLH
tara:strand:- start:74 stop:259 length:186 start_codon:yes stop_codon:yes gene_type:complete